MFKIIIKFNGKGNKIPNCVKYIFYAFRKNDCPLWSLPKTRIVLNYIWLTKLVYCSMKNS